MRPSGSAARNPLRSGTSTPTTSARPGERRLISVISARYGMIVAVPACTSTVVGSSCERAPCRWITGSVRTAVVAGASSAPARPRRNPARPATVGRRSMWRRTTSHSRSAACATRSRSRPTMRATNSESPPRSKKSSLRVTSSTARSSAHSSARSLSSSSLGRSSTTTGALSRGSQDRRRARSVFPFAVRGSVSTTCHTEGSMYSGSRVAAVRASSPTGTWCRSSFIVAMNSSCPVRARASRASGSEVTSVAACRSRSSRHWGWVRKDCPVCSRTSVHARPATSRNSMETSSGRFSSRVFSTKTSCPPGTSSSRSLPTAASASAAACSVLAQTTTSKVLGGRCWARGSSSTSKRW